jgi:hypothetical protein
MVSNPVRYALEDGSAKVCVLFWEDFESKIVDACGVLMLGGANVLEEFFVAHRK